MADVVAAADVPGRRAGAAAQGAADVAARRREDDPEQLIAVRVPPAGVRRRSIGTARRRSARPRRSRSITVGRPAGVPRRALPAAERRADRRRRRHAPTPSCRKLEKAFGGWKGGPAPATAAAGDAPQLTARQIYLDRQARRGAVADPDRLGRRPAIDARLLRAARAQHDPRRVVHVAAEHESARRARLRVRRRARRFDMRAARRPVLRRRRRADRQDRRSAEGVLQGARRASTSRCRPRSSRRRRTIWRCSCRATSRRRAARRTRSRRCTSTACRRTTTPPTRDRVRAVTAARRQARRRQVHPARQVRGGDRRRPQGDRAGRSRR